MGGVAIKKARTFSSLVPPKVIKAQRAKELASAPSCDERGPTLYIHGVNVPALAGRKLGDEFEATVRCKLRSTSLSEREGGQPRQSYDLEITAISVD